MIKPTCTVILLCFLALVHTVSAQDNTPEETPDEDKEFFDLSLEELFDIPINITKRDETVQESAMNLRIITRADIENYGFRTLTDVMMFMESTFETSKGQDRVFGVRGVMGYANDKIKFLIDGQEFPMMLGLGEGDFPITLDEVKRIEIAKGPNTSIYGGNATQATINIIRFSAEDYQGLRVGMAYGRWQENNYPEISNLANTAPFNDQVKGGPFHSSFYVNYLTAPTKDLSFNVYFAGAYQNGPKTLVREWWSDSYIRRFQRAAHNPLPDHELSFSMKYKNMKIMYRRIQSRQNHSGVKYNHNYSDAVALSYYKDSLFKSPALSLGYSVEASHYGNWYDTYHYIDKTIPGGTEHKAAKRLESDIYLRYTNKHKDTQVKIDALTGLSWNIENAIGTEFRDYSLNDTSALYNYIGDTSPENFPSFTEVNDIANVEPWLDVKIKPISKLSVNVGGRYAHDYVPGYQLRDTRQDTVTKYYTERTLLRKFFPKAVLVYEVKSNLFVKAMYQEGYNRPGVFEQFATQNTIPMRGRLKATTAKTFEAVVDYSINKKIKTKASVYSTNFYDFVNFAYTGSGWPAVNADSGEFRGFINVGDMSTQGVESSAEANYGAFGGNIIFGYIIKNQIHNIAETLSGASGITEFENGVGLSYKGFNRQSVPRYNFSTGAWFKPFYQSKKDLLTIGILYTSHRGAIVNSGLGTDPETGGLTIENLSALDLTLTSRPTEKMFFQIRVKNLTNNKNIRGSALDPGHFETQMPRYFEARATYTF